MTNFATYYKTKFRQDISLFFSSIPDQSKFHENNQSRQTFSIQYERLTRDFDHLNQLTKSDKEYFGVALFFTILTDMICYSNFKENYNEFKKLTHYPKFIGNCPSGCHYHYNPSDIFAAMNFYRSKPLDIFSPERLDFYEKFNEAIPIMEKETKDFFIEHLTCIDGQQFWEMCKVEFPYRLKSEKTNE